MWVPARDILVEILPLAITQVEWTIFIDICQRVLGYSPTRGVDSTHLDIKDPASYLGSIDMKNEPLKALREVGPTFAHFSVSFIAILDSDTLIEVAAQTNLNIYAKRGRKEYVAILSATMDIWHQTILHICSEKVDYSLREMGNIILARFEQASFREIFSKYTKKSLPDGTFTLRS